MRWVVDTAHPDAPFVACVRGRTEVARAPLSVSGRGTSELLRAIRSLERTCGSFARAQSITVAAGPGMFGAVRYGVVTVNALAWALGIPMTVCGRRVRIARPVYGKPPNITMSRVPE